MDFSFGVMTYNSSDYVLETLESIKYQVLNYGKNKKIELIISDDGSMDSTVEIVEKWITKNKLNFENIEIITVRKNTGTVQNYKRIFHRIKSTNFHIIAGDDLYTCNNIFKFSEYLKRYDIAATIPIGLNEDGQIFFSGNRVQRQIYRMRQKKYTCKKLTEAEMFGSFVHSPSTMFRKELLTSDIEKFVDQFYLYEDDPKYYELFKITNNIVFIMYPIVIYRHLSNSVCHASNNDEIKEKSFRADEINLCKCYISETHNPILKIYLRSKIKMVQKGGHFNIYKIIRGIDAIKVRISNKFSGGDQEILTELDELKKEIIVYYDKIKSAVLDKQEGHLNA